MIGRIEITGCHPQFSSSQKKFKTPKKFVRKYPIGYSKKDAYYENAARRYNSETKNLKFQYQKVIFYPEDVEKMKNMTLEEKNKYIIELKRAGKYKLKN